MSAFFLRVGAFRCSAPLEELGLPGLATRRKLRRNLYFSKALQQKFPVAGFADSETETCEITSEFMCVTVQAPGVPGRAPPSRLYAATRYALHTDISFKQ